MGLNDNPSKGNKTNINTKRVVHKDDIDSWTPNVFWTGGIMLEIQHLKKWDKENGY